MSFVNNYKPKPTQKGPSKSESEGPYDINWSFALPPALETKRVKLVPFIPSLHMQPFANAIKDHPQLFQYMPLALEDPNEFQWLVELLRADSTSILFCIIDKTTPDASRPELGGSMAGLIGLYTTSAQNLTTEIGPVIVAPAFQRTHVSSNAIGIIMHYALDLASAGTGGLGMRRAQWKTHPTNVASVKVAERMGLAYEGTMRWAFVLPEGKEGRKSREGDPLSGLGRDSVLFAICWDDWENSVREKVDQLMDE